MFNYRLFYLTQLGLIPLLVSAVLIATAGRQGSLLNVVVPLAFFALYVTCQAFAFWYLLRMQRAARILGALS